MTERYRFALQASTVGVWSMVLLAGFLLWGCQEGKTIKIKGSDTVLPITQQLAEHLAEADSSLKLSVTGGGSGVGIKALIDGNTDVAQASRDIKLKEVMILKEKGVAYVEYVLAYDGLALVVHPDNPIDQLTREQVEAIFTGKITNWQELGGQDRGIVPYIRETSSGTYEFFKKVLLQGRDYTPEALMEPSNGSLIQSVKNDVSSIAYVGLPFIEPGVKPLALSFGDQHGYVQPTEENAKARTYPVVRPLYYFYRLADSLRLRPLLRFLNSPTGQQVIAQAGGLPAGGEDSDSNTAQSPTPADSSKPAAGPAASPADTPQP